MRRKKVRVFQQARDVKRHGKKNAKWYISYVPPGRRRKVECIGSRQQADDRATELELELNRGTYRAIVRVAWDKFVDEYDRLHLRPNTRTATRTAALGALDHFKRLRNPTAVDLVTQLDVDEFSAARLQEPGNKIGATLSPNTLHSNLLAIGAALRWAKTRHYLAEVPTMTDYEMETDHHAVTLGHFSMLYEHAGAAQRPAYDGQLYSTEQFWRSVLLFAFTTGWRRSQIFTLKWSDVNLNTGEIVAIGLHEGNKGGRNEHFFLPDATLAHIKALWHPGDHVFWWTQDARGLYEEFERIQDAAGIDLPCVDYRQHQCSRACHRYGFHCVRRGFATENESKMTPRELQVMMQHKDFSTTLKYIEDANRDRRKQEVAARVTVPAVAQR